MQGKRARERVRRAILQDWKASTPRIRIAAAPAMQAYRDLFDVKLGVGLALPGAAKTESAL